MTCTSRGRGLCHPVVTLCQLIFDFSTSREQSPSVKRCSGQCKLLLIFSPSALTWKSEIQLLNYLCIVFPALGRKCAILAGLVIRPHTHDIPRSCPQRFLFPLGDDSLFIIISPNVYCWIAKISSPLRVWPQSLVLAAAVTLHILEDGMLSLVRWKLSSRWCYNLRAISL